MSFPNHLPPDHYRPVTSTPITVNHHAPNEKQRRNLYLQHGTAGIVAFTLGRLFVMVPSQNYKNAAIVSGHGCEEPKYAFEGQSTEVARIISEYTVKNIADRALINYSGFSARAQEPIARFVTSLLVSPLQIARVREARGERLTVIEAFKESFTFEKMFFLAVHETLATIIGDFIAEKGAFDFSNHFSHRYEVNLRLSQLAASFLLTPLEVFAKRVAVSQAIDDVWKREYERMRTEAEDCGGFCKYLAKIAVWNIPEALGMVLEKLAYRKVVDNWPVKASDLE